jgi:hypothetical protein
LGARRRFLWTNAPKRNQPSARREMSLYAALALRLRAGAARADPTSRPMARRRLCMVVARIAYREL